VNTPMMLCGAVAAAGVVGLIRQAVRPQPALAPVLRRTPPGAVDAGAGQGEAWGRWLVDHLAGLPGVRIPHRDLQLLGRTAGRFLLTKVVLAVAGLLLPAAVVAPWLLLGMAVPVYLPAAAGVAAAAGLWVVPDLEVRDRARRARTEFAHAMAAYLDLVAHGRAADLGPNQALEQAARIGQGWAFTRLQQALAQARVDQVPPWQGLLDLTRALGLPALDDVAEIMRISAHDGAAVARTLRERAAALRAQLLADAAAEANAVSEKMTAPGALLAVLIMAGVAFPAVIRILTI